MKDFLYKTTSSKEIPSNILRKNQRPIHRNFSVRPLEKNNCKNLILIKNIKNNNEKNITKDSKYAFCNELKLVKLNKIFATPFKKLIIIHFEVFGQINWKKNSQNTIFISSDFDEFFNFLIEENYLVIIVSDLEYKNKILECLEKKKFKFHVLYSITSIRNLINEGNIILNYSSILEDLNENCDKLEEIFVLQTINKSKFTNKNKRNFCDFENKIGFFKSYLEISVKFCYFKKELSLHQKAESLKNIFQKFDLEKSPFFQNLNEIFLEFKMKYNEKLKNIKLLQHLKNFKKNINSNYSQLDLKCFEDFFNKKQIETRKTFYDYLIQLKKIPKVRNICVGPMIDSLLERNIGIFKHIGKIQFEKKNEMEQIFEHLSVLKSEFEGKSTNKFKEVDEFINLCFKNNFYII